MLEGGPFIIGAGDYKGYKNTRPAVTVGGDSWVELNALQAKGVLHHLALL